MKKISFFLKKCLTVFSKILIKSEYFTVFFFLIIFVIGLWVWKECCLDVGPSKEVKQEFEAGKEDFDNMKEQTKKAINTLKKKTAQFEDDQDFSAQRELFKTTDDQNNIDYVSITKEKNDDQNQADEKEKDEVKNATEDKNTMKENQPNLESTSPETVL